jgi:hypothetical protein
MSSIGEEGTEQFTVTTRVNQKLIREQAIHDPFVRTTVVLKGIGHAWRALRGGIKVQMSIDGTHGAVRAVMALDPEKCDADNEAFLRQMSDRRNENAAADVRGYYASEATGTRRTK